MSPQYFRVAKVFAVFAFVLVHGFVAAGAFGDPRGFLVNQQVSETVVYPGVKYIRADGSHLGLPMVTHVVTVDMTDPGVKLQMLPGERLVTASSGQFFRRSRVSHMQQDNNALVAINSAFFDISATMAPSGLHVRDGMMLRQPATGNPSFAVTEDGLAFINSFGWSRNVRYGTGTAALQGVNNNIIGDNNIALYQYPWDRSPATNAAFINGRAVTEVVIGKVAFTKSSGGTQRHLLRGKVLEVRNNKGSVGLNATNYVLTATGTSRSFLQQMTVGSTVDVDWLLSSVPSGINWSRISEVVSGNNLLIVNGVLQNGSGSHWESRHPRSVVGINESQTKVLFLLVEGRQSGRAEGMSLDSVRNYVSHMGVYNCLELDGGGSSAMAGRINGNNVLLSTPSDGSERYVPSGLGVVAVPEMANPFFQNVRVSTGHDMAAISWETPEPAISYLLYGKEGYDIESIRNQVPSKRHTIFLSGLESHTLYFARMAAETGAGTQTSQSQQFTTSFEVVVDDAQAAFDGTWSTGAFEVPYGPSYRWSNVDIASSPTRTATFRPNLPASGHYDLYVWFTPGGNRTTEARYDIKNQAGTQVLTQSQRTGGNNWTLLASNMAFDSGTNGFAKVRNDSTVGTVVIADAFRWVLNSPAPMPHGEVPTWWREHFFGVNAPDASTDVDEDGYSIYEEYIWGTVPDDSTSSPRTIFEQTQGGGFQLTFSPVRADRVYRIEASTDLDSWTTFNVPLQEVNGQGIVNLPVESGLGQRYYRLRVALP
ncbi:MAG: phosphodiester glycosidase family protein [Verrucomicrobia bacterium]|nr:phosphodiester glycosidase family protein [Verrucomicrobiota bacterium]